MLINPLNNILSTKNNKIPFRKLSPIRLSHTSDTFYAKSLNYEDFLNLKKKFQIETYKRLNESTKNELRYLCKTTPIESTANSITNFADENIKVALKLKAQLDKEYGENQYVFVCIGNSPALIAKIFECMGIETKYLPITRLSYAKTPFPIPEKYDEILSKQNISRLDMEKSKKHYLFYDYTISGLSLELMENYIKLPFISTNEQEYEKLCLDPKMLNQVPELKTIKNKGLSYETLKRIHFKSLNQDIFCVCEDFEDARRFIDFYFKRSKSSYVSSIGHLLWYDVEKTVLDNKNLTKHDRLSIKLFNFIVMDKLNSMGLLKYNPENASSL